MNRAVLSGPRLYAVLSRAFEDARSKGCVSCRMPLPVLGAGFDPEEANWYIGEVPRCAHGCHMVIGQVAATVAVCLDIEWPYVRYGSG